MDITGEIGEGISTKSHLKLDWKTATSGYCFIYKCMATGLDVQGNDVKVFRTGKVKGRGGESCAVKTSTNEILNYLLAQSYKCSRTVQRASNQLIQQEIDSLRQNVDGLVQLQTSVDQNSQQIVSLNTKTSLFTTISNLTEVNNNSLSDVDNQVSLLASKLSNDWTHSESLFNDLEGRISSLSEKVILKYKQAKQGSSGNILSSVYNGIIYAIATCDGDFNLILANNLCKLYGGYLVELDGGDDEQTFVGNFLSANGITSAFTGGNDVDTESTFKYINSDTLFVNESWAQSEPSSQGLGAEDDCVTIRQDGKLSEEACTVPGQYVCEIPLEFDF